MLWDTAGQEEFDAITKAYYRGAQACVVGFSTTDRLSFEAVRKWKKKVWNMILLHGFSLYRLMVIQGMYEDYGQLGCWVFNSGIQN